MINDVVVKDCSNVSKITWILMLESRIFGSRLYRMVRNKEQIKKYNKPNY